LEDNKKLLEAPMQALTDLKTKQRANPPATLTADEVLDTLKKAEADIKKYKPMFTPTDTGVESLLLELNSTIRNMEEYKKQRKEQMGALELPVTITLDGSTHINMPTYHADILKPALAEDQREIDTLAPKKAAAISPVEQAARNAVNLAAFGLDADTQ